MRLKQQLSCPEMVTTKSPARGSSVTHGALTMTKIFGAVMLDSLT